MRLIGLVLAGLVAVSACGGVPEVHSIVIPGQGRAQPLPVEIDDQAGIVSSIELNGADRPPLEPVVALAGDPAAIAVTWTGGLCDTATRLTITSEPPGIRITETTTVRPGGCRLVGIYRTLLFRLAEPIPVEAIALVRQP